jgi:hypothetical protein
MKTPSNGGRAGRVEKRAVKTMGRAQKNWTKAEAIRKFDKGGSSAIDSPAAAKANKLYDRSARQGEKAKRQMEKADYLKAKKAPAKSSTSREMSSKAGKMAGSLAPTTMLGSAGKKQLMNKTVKKK